MQKEGVGEMTPSIIKLPFWEMTYKNEKVFYACLNQKKSSAPEHIKRQRHLYSRIFGRNPA